MSEIPKRYYEEINKWFAEMPQRPIAELVNDMVTKEVAALQQVSSAMAERLEHHNRGTTHYEGCEADHPDCAALAAFRTIEAKDK